MLYDPNSYFFKSFLSYGSATTAKAKKALEEKAKEDEKESK